MVLGNQTCDLDSAVCALVQGLLEYTDAKRYGQSDVAVIPVMNIPEKEFSVKTEVIYSLKFHDVQPNLLTFRDQIDLQNLQNDIDKRLELILVDHHTLVGDDVALKPSVVAIIDHRPLDPAWSWPDVSLNIETVGSCATLVARNILKRNPNMLDAWLSSLLRGPILVDTYNMSDEVGRATATDVDVLNSIERLGGLASDRTETFNKIMYAKTDISELTLEDLMIKDLKVTNGIPLLGFPLLVENFLKCDNAKETIEKLVSDRNCTVHILIGHDVSSEHVSRDIAVFSTGSDQLRDAIIEALTSSTKPNLNLELITELQEGGYSLHLYRQRNVKMTREQILSIVQKASLLKN